MRLKDYIDYSEDEEIEDNRQSVQKILKKHLKKEGKEIQQSNKKNYDRTRIKKY